MKDYVNMLVGKSNHLASAKAFRLKNVSLLQWSGVFKVAGRRDCKVWMCLVEKFVVEIMYCISLL